MARLTKRRTPQQESHDDLPAPDRAHGALRQRQPRAASPPTVPSSPDTSSSNKENSSTSPQLTRKSHTGKRDMADADQGHDKASKRRRTTNEATRQPTNADASQAALRQEINHVGNREFYDPDQPMTERRAVRRGFRDLHRDLADSRNDFLAANSTGLTDTINKANDLFRDVKQTADATLDARLLVVAGDLTARRAVQTNLGEGSGGIDIDDFVTKSIAFMRRGPGEHETAVGSSSQSARRRRSEQADEDSGLESDDESNAMNWAWLGERAAYPFNTRPPTPGFLLGPLSVQKKTRKQTQRTQRLQRRDIAEAVRPDEMEPQDLARNENANLKVLCTRIQTLLSETQREAEARVSAEIAAAGDDISEEEQQRILQRHNVSETSGICLYRFAFNPRSFGQTVENLFYLSFLIRDGWVGIEPDRHGQPTLCSSAPSSLEESRRNGSNKRQAVFHLDYDNWRGIIDAFGITKSIIPHRESTEGPINARGWYG